MYDLAKTTLFGVYKYSGAMYAQETMASLGGQPFTAVLLFHRVTDDIPEDSLTVGTRRFRGICQMLRRQFNVVPLREIVHLHKTRAVAPKRTVAITFDDCYRDNLFAARVLSDLGLPASFFVPTAFVDTDRVFAWDKQLPPMPNLSWNDVREMAAMGFEIGSHTVTHANLAALSAAELRHELVQSKKTIENETGQPVRHLAYPFGGKTNFRAEQWQDACDAGYEAVLSGHGGFVLATSTTPLLPRIPVPDFSSALHLELFLRGCLQWIYECKRRVGLV